MRAWAISQLIDERGSFTAFMGGFTTFLLLRFLEARSRVLLAVTDDII